MNKKILLPIVLLAIALYAPSSYGGKNKFADLMGETIRTYVHNVYRPSLHIQPNDLMKQLKKGFKELQLPLRSHYLKEEHLWEALKKFPKLKLNCGGITCSEKFIQQYGKNITGITLSDRIDVTSELLDYLPNLQELMISCTLTNDKINDLVDSLQRNKTITSLTIKNTSIDKDDANAILEIFDENTTIKNLNFVNTPMSNKAKISIVVNFATIKDIKYFDMEGDNIHYSF
jgi:hypothetical protein